jgi:hypothetical protein
MTALQRGKSESDKEPLGVVVILVRKLLLSCKILELILKVSCKLDRIFLLMAVLIEAKY